MSTNGIGNGMGARTHQMHFQRMDGNGDGKLDANELQRMAERISQKTGQNVTGEELLKKFDQDGSGDVSQSELPPPPPPWARGQNDFSSGNEALSKEQLEAMAQRISERRGEEVSTDDLLERFDTDGDGQVTKQEMMEKRQKMQQEVMARMQALRMSQT